MAQAAVVASWFRTTRSPEKMMMFLLNTELMAEVTRRGAETEALRYGPLFERGWRAAHSRLSTVIKHSCEGSTALNLTASMVVQVAGSPDVTAGSVAALEVALDGVEATLDTSKLRDADNETRVAAAIPLLLGRNASKGTLRDDTDTRKPRNGKYCSPIPIPSFCWRFSSLSHRYRYTRSMSRVRWPITRAQRALFSCAAGRCRRKRSGCYR